MVIINKAPDDIFSKEMTIQAVDFQSFYMYNSRKTDVIHIDCIFPLPDGGAKNLAALYRLVLHLWYNTPICNCNGGIKRWALL